MAEDIFGRKTLEKLGRRLRDAEIPDQKDLDSLQAYRSSYKDVISEVFHIVDENAKSVCKSAICAFRIKRIDSIIGKLRRLRGELELKSMYDIAGCRCIVEKDAEIYKIIAKLQQSNLQIVKIKDNIGKRVKESGYRSVHIYVYLEKFGDRKQVEIQLRTKVHHNWATFVETIDHLYNLKVKEEVREEKKGTMYDDFVRFHQIMSKSPNRITKDEKIFLLDTIVKHNIIGKLTNEIIQNVGWNRLQWIEIKHSDNILEPICSYVIATKRGRTPEILGFSAFDQAEQKYYELFSSNKDNSNIVLLNMPNATYSQLTVAYSNYLLAGHEFMRVFNQITIDMFDVTSGIETKQLKPYFNYCCSLTINEYNKYMKKEHELLRMTNQLSPLLRAEWVYDVKKRYTELYNDNQILKHELEKRYIYEQQHTKFGKFILKMFMWLFKFLRHI